GLEGPGRRRRARRGGARPGAPRRAGARALRTRRTAGRRDAPPRARARPRAGARPDRGLPRGGAHGELREADPRGRVHPSHRPPGSPAGTNYLAYLYPGILALVLLFTAIFATISTVEDRHSGFLQGVLVAPVSRTAIVVGQALGGTTLAVGQGALFLALAPLAGLRPPPLGLLGALGVMVVVAFGLTNLGLLIAWRMESTQ